MAPRIAAVALLLPVLAAACIVTDDIQFEDAVNHPPEVIDVTPANDQITPVCPETQELTVTVWEPDAEDAAFYGAQIFARWTRGATGGWEYDDSCDPPVELDDPGDGDHAGGARVRLTCELPLEFINIDESDPTMLVLVRVADLGFFQGQVRDGARTAEVLWVLEVQPEVACP